MRKGTTKKRPARDKTKRDINTACAYCFAWTDRQQDPCVPDTRADETDETCESILGRAKWLRTRTQRRGKPSWKTALRTHAAPPVHCKFNPKNVADKGCTLPPPPMLPRPAHSSPVCARRAGADSNLEKSARALSTTPPPPTPPGNGSSTKVGAGKAHIRLPSPHARRAFFLLKQT